jgi:topoisomerase-4 subunit A
VKHDLANLVDYAVAYFENLLKKYGKGRERKTEIKTIEVIEAKNVAIANAKLYMNREDGFVGTGLRKDEFLFDCSTLDDVIVFTKHGIMKVVKVAEKTYIGKGYYTCSRISEK